MTETLWGHVFRGLAPHAVPFFEVGKLVYVDFTEADAA